MTSTVLAVGGHIGDMDLTAGPTLAKVTGDGGRAIIVALTYGERGHPKLSPADYKEQKIAEGRSFAEQIGAEFHVFDYSDGFLPNNDEVASQLATLIRQTKPDTLIAHWKHSIHSDHEHASAITERARFLASLPSDHELPRHGIRQLLYAENWEDAEGYLPNVSVPIPDEAFERWHSAISGQAFARGETYGFRYIDYYTALMTVRGCLAGHPRAAGFHRPTTGPQPLTGL